MYLELGLTGLGYLLGSISPGYFFGKLVKGKDIRKYGNRNTGATNTYKVVGPVYGVIAALFDFTKGAIAMVLAISLGLHEFVVYGVGLFAVIGHNYPFYLGFQGGKGVATSLGLSLLAIVYYGSLYAFLLTLVFVLRAVMISKNFRGRIHGWLSG